MSADPLLDRLARALAGRYTVARELGRGGMATVYLATDVKLGRRVAIKVLPPTTRAYLGSGRFQREVLFAAQLSHPHIVPLFEADEADGLLFYVMEYVEGESLHDRLERDGPLAVEEAIRITAEVGDALEYAHESGVIHRDIKPGNILLSRGHAMVSDFGIAKVLFESGTATGGSAITGTGITVGTAEYMSPEQASGEKRIDARSDVYALAAVLYEMLAGEPPFTGPSAEVTVGAYAPFLVVTHSPAPWAQTPPATWPVTGVLWAEAQAFCRWRDPAARLPTEAEWEAAAGGLSGTAYPWGNSWEPRRANAAGATDTLKPVGSFPLGRSGNGAVDLIGNAWEWVAAETVSSSGQLVHAIKGGAFDTPPRNAVISYRGWFPEDRRAVWKTGFRCVRHPPR